MGTVSWVVAVVAGLIAAATIIWLQELFFDALFRLLRLGGRGDSSRVYRECPHCSKMMPCTATVCPRCQRESEAWILKDGVWWTQEQGIWWLFDDKRDEWVELPTPPEAKAP